MESNSFHNKKFLIVVAGPTASGKTSLALTIAQKYNCEIFSCDSRQIYKEMTIGTAKPSDHQLAMVKHHFINHKSISDSYDVGQYVDELATKLEFYFATNDIALWVGGTGLYFNSFIQGIDEFPDLKPHILEDLEKLFLEEGLKPLQELLLKHDPDYYHNVDLNNSRRVIRALSVCLSSGQPYSLFLGRKKSSLSQEVELIPILLNPHREKLYETINLRVDSMINDGLVAEALSLHNQKDLRALDTVGYRELFDHFEGKTSLQEAIEKIKIHSRRYAKRQVTWFKKYGKWCEFQEVDVSNIIQEIECQIALKNR